MPPVRAVLFDYGHTLADFTLAEENLLDCYEEIRFFLQSQAEREVPEARDLVELVSGNVARQVMDSYRRQDLQEVDLVALFSDALQGVGFSLTPDAVRQIAQMEHRAMIANISAPEENLGVLRRLRELGLRLGLVSNAALLPEMMHEDITRLGIAGYMDSAVFSSEVGVRKPHPAIFMRVLSDLDVEGSEAVFVGDRLHDDIGGAQVVGMRGILTRQYRQEDPAGSPVMPDLVVERLPDILRYIRDLQRL